MKYRALLLSVILFLLANLSGVAFAQSHNIQIFAQIDPATIPQNQTATLKIVLQWDGPANLFDVDEITQPKLNNLTVAGSGSTSRVAAEGGVQKTIKEYIFQLKPSTIGMAYVEPMRLVYSNFADSTQSTLQTQRIELKVTEPVIKKEGKLTMTVAVIGLSIFLLLLGASIFWYRRQQVKATAELNQVIVKSPAETVLEDLKQQLSRTDPANVAAKCEALAKAVRTYIREGLQIQAASVPTPELREALKRNGAEAGTIELFITILEKCDEVKFAKKELPITEFEGLCARFEDFLK